MVINHNGSFKIKYPNYVKVDHLKIVQIEINGKKIGVLGKVKEKQRFKINELNKPKIKLKGLKESMNI